MIIRYVIASVLLLMSGCHPVFAYEDLVKVLRQYATVTLDSYGCENDSKADGWYRPSANRIELCVDNIQANWPEYKHQDIYKKVLMHEAMHLAQDCHAGIHNTLLRPFDVNTLVPDYVVRRYSEEDHIIEAEAFSYWHKGDAPLHLVRTYCN